METRVLSNLNILGALVMSKDETDFPADPAIGTFVIKDQCLFGYLKIGGMETWYPFANKTNSYVHVQAIDALTWTVTHNLGTSDVWIQVKDQSGNILSVGKTDIDENSFQLTFTEAVRGTAVVVAPDSIDVPGVKASFIDVANGVVHIESSGVRVNGEYVLTNANIDAQIELAVAAEATIRANADLNLQNQIDNLELSDLVDTNITSIQNANLLSWNSTSSKWENRNLAASDIPSLDASKITTGTLSAARMGSGTANSTTYLRGDRTWQTITSGATITNITTNGNYYPTFTTTTSGAMTDASVTSTKLSFNPSTGNLKSTSFEASSGFILNSNTILANFTVSAGLNAMSAGPINVADGVTVTISDGSAWTVV